MIKIYPKDRNLVLSYNLYLSEVKCKCSNIFCTATIFDTGVAECFERLRSLCGDLPIKINSAYRCQEHNYKLEKSSKVSQHMLGRALDCVPPKGIKLIEFEKEAKTAGFTYTYINEDKNFCHMDIRS